MVDTQYPAGYPDRGLDKVITPRFGDWIYRLRAWANSRGGGVEDRARRVVRKMEWHDVDPQRPTILCLDRALFRKDVIELRKRLPYNFPVARATTIKKYQEHWIPPQWRRQTFFGDYLNGPLEASRPLLARFGRSFLEQASRINRIDAVMAANTDYWQDDAIRLGCKELGIPFLVLSRENYLWPASAQMVKLQYKAAKFVYGGAGVAVASAPTRDTLYETGGFEDGAVWLTGWPRFDAWRDIAMIDVAARRTVTLVSYGDPLYLAPENFREVLDGFINLAERHRGRLRCVLKVKKQNEVALHFERHPRLRNAPIDVVSEEPLPSLFAESKIVVGFNSTAVVEALLSGAAVVVPTWGDSRRSAEASGLHYSRGGDREVAFFPESSVELTQLLDGLLENRLTPLGDASARLQRFSEYSHVEEGKLSSELVGEFIDHYVSKQSRPWLDHRARGA